MVGGLINCTCNIDTNNIGLETCPSSHSFICQADCGRGGGRSRLYLRHLASALTPGISTQAAVHTLRQQSRYWFTVPPKPCTHMLAFGRSAPVPGWYWNCWLSAGIVAHVALVTACGHCTPFWPGNPGTSRHDPVLVVMRPVFRSWATAAAVPGGPAASPAHGTRTPPLPMHSVVERS